MGLHLTSAKHCNADGLSRLPRPGPAAVRDGVELGTKGFNMHQLEALPLSAKQLKDATTRDPQLSMVFRYTQEGWPAEVWV